MPKVSKLVTGRKASETRGLVILRSTVLLLHPLLPPGRRAQKEGGEVGGGGFLDSGGYLYLHLGSFLLLLGSKDRKLIGE